MIDAFRSGAAAIILTMSAAIEPAIGQLLPFPSQQGTPPAGAPPGTKPSPPKGPVIAGNWSGQLTQVGGETPVKLELSVSAKGAETKHPDLDCAGKLIRIGASKSYVFFVEIIIKGRTDKGGRCPDGTMTIARQGDNVAVGWFGSVGGDTIVAYGSLAKAQR
jgi:hypothetical protein